MCGNPILGGYSLRGQGENCCVVCGKRDDQQAPSYLLVARTTPSRLAILRWDRTLAACDGARTACSPEHALEVVAHWMVSGRLYLGLARAARQLSQEKSASSHLGLAEGFGGEHRPTGEVVIDRESVRRLVASDPEALASLLDSLLEALLRDRNPTRKRPEGSTASAREISIA